MIRKWFSAFVTVSASWFVLQLFCAPANKLDCVDRITARRVYGGDACAITGLPESSSTKDACDACGAPKTGTRYTATYGSEQNGTKAHALKCVNPNDPNEICWQSSYELCNDPPPP